MRELKEETGLDGSNWRFLGDSTFEYPDRLLHFFLFSCLCSNLQPLECENSHIWAEPDQLSSYPMPDANQSLLQIIQTKLKD
jgi:8-oxo-dGTP pyrophosphatase MutT (NUDIX family)